MAFRTIFKKRAAIPLFLFILFIIFILFIFPIAYKI